MTVLARCPFCGFTVEVTDAQALLKAAKEHLLTDSACGEKLMKRLVDGSDVEAKQ